jgi:hypothetical protein
VGVVLLLAAGPPPVDGRESARSSRETAMLAASAPIGRSFRGETASSFMSQFAAPMTSWWETLSNPTLTRGLQERLTEGRRADGGQQYCGVSRAAALRDLHPQGSPAYEYPTKGSPGLWGYQGHAGIPAQPASPSYGYLSSPLCSSLRFRLCLSPVAVSRQSASED